MDGWVVSDDDFVVDIDLKNKRRKDGKVRTERGKELKEIQTYYFVLFCRVILTIFI